MSIVKASESKYRSQLDALVRDILAGTAAIDLEIPWLTDLIYETNFHDCDFVAYHADSFKDWGLSDEGIRDGSHPIHCAKGYSRLKQRHLIRKYLCTKYCVN